MSTNSDVADILAKFVLVVFAIVLLIPLIWVNAYIFSDIWLLFAVPLGAPIVSVWHMAGLLLLVSFLKFSVTDSTETDGKAWTRLLTGIGATLAFWGMAHLYHWFDTIGFIG
jgi:hypothetical protein